MGVADPCRDTGESPPCCFRAGGSFVNSETFLASCSAGRRRSTQVTISKSKSFLNLRWYYEEDILLILIVPGVLVVLGLLLYQFSSPATRNPRDFSGRIVEKRVSVF